jgi:hypothetical protein
MSPGGATELQNVVFDRAEYVAKSSRALAPARHVSLTSPGFTLFIAACFAAICVLAIPASAQTATPPAQTPPDSSPQPTQPKGQVIFSRSIDENGQVTTITTAPQTVAAPKAQLAPPQVAERQAVTFTAFDMDVRLRTAEQHIAVRALITVRNDGTVPLARIPLQLSSTLNWERIRLDGKDLTFPVATLNSDADHTGQLHEAAVSLAQPLAPGASLQLDVTYSGDIVPSAQRLLTIGTPAEVALRSDWDQIGVSFTGIRGFGDVVWYPVSSVPVILGDGARLFDEIGEHKLRLSGAHFRLRLTVEFPHGSAPTVALINGHPAALTITEAPGPEPVPGQDLDQTQQLPGIATTTPEDSILGFDAPSLFVAIRKSHNAANTTVWALPEDDSAVDDWTAAATIVTPLLQRWLGENPHSQLTVLDLPDPQDAPFETGALLVTAIRKTNPDQLDGNLAHALTHAYLHTATQSPPAWLDEGVAHFMGTLWVESQRGRQQALGALEAARPALALAEPESPGESAGQPLGAATSPVYYRTKAAYVFWMLRDLAGDPALSAALRAYDPAGGAGRQDGEELASASQTCLGTTLVVPQAQQNESWTLAPAAKDSGKPSAFPAACTPVIMARSPFEKLLESSGDHRDLAWFFADWVDADKGLPDLKIDGVFPTTAEAGNWLVAVDVSNNGYASCEVPVTVRADSNSVTERLMVPARGKAVQRILILGKPLEVQVNDGTVPEIEATVHITKIADASPGIPPAEPPQPQPK